MNRRLGNFGRYFVTIGFGITSLFSCSNNSEKIYESNLYRHVGTVVGESEERYIFDNRDENPDGGYIVLVKKNDGNILIDMVELVNFQEDTLPNLEDIFNTSCFEKDYAILKRNN